MKTIKYFCFFLFLLLICSCSDQKRGEFSVFTSGTETNKIEFNTDSITGKWINMWNTYELSDVFSLFMNDPILTYFSSEKEGLIKGFNAVLKHHEDFGFVEGGKESTNILWLEDIYTNIQWPVVIVTAIWYFKNKESEDVQKGPVTMVYVQKDGEYRLMHLQFANY